MSDAAAIALLRERIAQACRVLGTLGLASANTGHISARVPGTDRVLIRARGPGELGVRYTTAGQVIEVGLDGTVVDSPDPSLAAPIEVFIHTALYRARPDVGAVVHVHPPAIVLFTICEVPLLPIVGAYNPAAARLAIEGIPTFERSILIDSPALGDQIAQTIGAKPICLMRGHGITAAGPSVEEAALTVIALNDLAEMNFRARQLGTPRPIPAEDQAVFGGGTLRAGRAPALWRYYTTLIGEPPEN